MFFPSLSPPYLSPWARTIENIDSATICPIAPPLFDHLTLIHIASMSDQVWNQFLIPPLDICPINEQCNKEIQDDLDRLITLRFKEILKYDQRDVPKIINLYSMNNLSVCSLKIFAYLPAFTRASICQGWYEPLDESVGYFCTCLNYSDEDRLVPSAYFDIYKSFYENYENNLKPSLAHLHHVDRDDRLFLSWRQHLRNAFLHKLGWIEDDTVGR